jgi:hypothetical protein
MTTDRWPDTVEGLGVRAGIAEGIVRVVRDLDEADIDEGTVLVCRATDPSWASLFPLGCSRRPKRWSPPSMRLLPLRNDLSGHFSATSPARKMWSSTIFRRSSPDSPSCSMMCPRRCRAGQLSATRCAVSKQFTEQDPELTAMRIRLWMTEPLLSALELLKRGPAGI